MARPQMEPPGVGGGMGGEEIPGIRAVFSSPLRMKEVLSRDSRVAEVLAQHHLSGCSSCALQDVDTLSDAARIHSVDLPRLLHDLNALYAPA